MTAGEAISLALSSGSELPLRALVDALGVAVFATDADGRVTYFNAAAAKLCGRVPEIGVDRWSVTWKMYLPDGTPLSSGECPLAMAMQEGPAPGVEEYIGERPDGTRFWFTSHPAVLRDEKRRITGGIDVLVEITDRKAAQMEAHAQFRAMVEATPECVKLVAADGTLLQMNSAGLGMVDASTAEEVIGKNVYNLIAAEDRERFREFNEKVCQGQKASLEFGVVGLQGTRRQMETHAAPLRQPDGTTAQLAITRDVTARSKAERASLLLGAIVDSSDDAIISKDLNGIITSWNQGAEKLFRYNAGEAVGQPITILIPPERLDEETEILSRLKRGERVDHFETVRRTKNGESLDVSLTISPVKDRHGTVVGASKIARDITGRKRAEEAIQTLNAQLTADLAAMTRLQELSTRLVQAEDFQELLGEIIDTAMAITHADMGDIQLLEDGLLKITSSRGFDTAVTDLSKQMEAGQAACAKALESGQRIIVEDVAKSPLFSGSAAREAMLAAGARAVQSTPLRRRSGAILGMFSTYYRSSCRPGERELRLLDILARQAADLIERKQADTALQASEKRFRQLADAMPQMVWTARADGEADYFNERWYEFTGFPRDIFGGSSWERLLHPEDLEPCRDAWNAAVRSGEPFQTEYRFWDRFEHRWRWFMGRALPIRDTGGGIVKWFGATTDIDEQKRVEDDLRRANRDLEQFAFSASHDLQEPLRSIQVYSELLTKRCGSLLDAQGLEFLGFLHGGAMRLDNLVRDLLAYTRVTQVADPHETADANEALAASLASLAGAISETRAQVTQDALPAVKVHAAYLQQLFQNLIGNALKYRSAERPPTVHITAEQQRGEWLFSVRDNGIGIDPEFKDKIFGLFTRLHSDSSYSGTGIGLAICQRIVDRYQGKIWVESETGKGSTFRFTLPE